MAKLWAGFCLEIGQVINLSNPPDGLTAGNYVVVSEVDGEPDSYLLEPLGTQPLADTLNDGLAIDIDPMSGTV